MEEFSKKTGGNRQVKVWKEDISQRKEEDGVQVYGRIKRDTKEGFFKCVADQTANTLIAIIKENICQVPLPFLTVWKQTVL